MARMEGPSPGPHATSQIQVWGHPTSESLMLGRRGCTGEGCSMQGLTECFWLHRWQEKLLSEVGVCPPSQGFTAWGT